MLALLALAPCDLGTTSTVDGSQLPLRWLPGRASSRVMGRPHPIAVLVVEHRRRSEVSASRSYLWGRVSRDIEKLSLEAKTDLEVRHSAYVLLFPEFGVDVGQAADTMQPNTVERSSYA